MHSRYQYELSGIVGTAVGRLRYFATMLNLLVPSVSAPRDTVTFTFQVPLIESWPVPRYVPLPAWVNGASLRIAGMFIAGMAGIENTAVTVASVTGAPFRSVTLTSIVLLPDSGGSGLL